MIFNISRASDDFIMDDSVKSKYKPHDKAVWKDDRWVIEIDSADDVVKLCGGDDKVVVSVQGDVPSIYIDDMSDYRWNKDIATIEIER